MSLMSILVVDHTVASVVLSSKLKLVGEEPKLKGSIFT